LGAGCEAAGAVDQKDGAWQGWGAVSFGLKISLIILASESETHCYSRRSRPGNSLALWRA
jgi:hypothetical protein